MKKTLTSVSIATAIFAYAVALFLANGQRGAVLLFGGGGGGGVPPVEKEKGLADHHRVLEPQEQQQEQEYSSPTRSTSHASNRETGHPGIQPPDNSIRLRFTLHPNWDGTGEGIVIDTKDYKDVDAIIEKHCCALMNLTASPERCAPNSGARLISDTGVRLHTFADAQNGCRVYCAPQALHFVWPLVKVGNVIYPKNVESPIPGKLIKLTQLSNSPRVFSVDNFVTPEEIDELLRSNRNRLAPSEVGFGGWRDDTRTSSTSWDFTSKAAHDIQRRSFELAGMDVEPEIADAMQVLRYTPNGYKNRGEWYKPHVDWFDAKGYDNNDPKVTNGTNRFVTIFLYLSDVEQGGHTVFPLSTTHQGYNGERLVHENTVNTPGYIDTKDALWCCNTSSTALRVAPRAGNAVMFYSQGPDGTLDPYSLHGGCPPIVGIKFSANVWIWNRQRPDKSKAKDVPADKKKPVNSFVANFKNMRGGDLDLYWDSFMPNDPSLEPYADVAAKLASQDAAAMKRLVFQNHLAKGMVYAVNTYENHVFVAIDSTTKEFAWVKKVSEKHIDNVYAAEGAVYDIV